MTDFSQPSTEFLTPEECAEVDKALLTSRDKFTARVAIYSLRSLRQIAQQSGQTIADLQTQQIAEWVANDPSLQQSVDSNFKGFFTQLTIASLKPLHQSAAEAGVAIEGLTVPQVVAWFEKEAKRRLERGI
jgi:hypothetical protein